ncbi:MAG: hypothetical protein KDK70_21315 [Myxococcales bacterium]|nr:hypothetical protein [Myxococcales bacterium]
MKHIPLHPSLCSLSCRLGRLAIAALGLTAGCDPQPGPDDELDPSGETDGDDLPVGLDVDDDFLLPSERPNAGIGALDGNSVALGSCTGFVEVDGQLRDVAPYTGGTWGIGWAPPFPGAHGYKIFERVGEDWYLRPGAAVRIASASDGTPWVVNDAGSIYKWSGAWNLQAGLGRDIAVADSNDVWVIGYNKKNPADKGYGVYYLDGTQWQLTNGRGTRIAVEPDGDSVWVVNSEQSLYRAEPSGTPTLSWVKQSLTAVDVAVTADGTPWIVGGAHHPDGYEVYYKGNAGWMLVDQTNLHGVSIGASPEGVVWVLGESGAIWVLDGALQC